VHFVGLFFVFIIENAGSKKQNIQTYSLMIICWNRNMYECFYVILCILALKSAF